MSNPIYTYYHITPTANLQSIFKTGQLTPQIGANSKALGETKPCIYCFDSLTEVDNALTNWLGEQFEDIESVTLIQFQLDHPLKKIAFECQSFQPIPITQFDKLVINI